MLQIVPHPEIKRQVVASLPGVLHKAREIIIVEVVLAHSGNRIGYLYKRAEVPAGQSVAQIDALDIGNPVAERCTAGVGVDSAALEQIDQQFVDSVDVHPGFESVSADCFRERVGKFQPMLIREGRARKSVRQPVGHHICDGDAGSRPVGADNFQILRPLKTEIVYHRR